MNGKYLSKRQARQTNQETSMFNTGIREIMDELSPFTDSEEPTPCAYAPVLS